MSRVSALPLSGLLSLLITAAILAPVLLFSWRLAVSEQQALLDLRAEAVFKNAEKIYADAVAKLNAIEGEDFVPCSASHIQRMAELQLQSLTVNNLAYSSDGYVRCNAFGMVKRSIPSDEVHLLQPDGIGIVLNWRGMVPERGPVLILQTKDYSALVDQRQFYERFMDDDDNTTISVRTLAGQELIPSFDEDQDEEEPLEENLLVSEVRSANWIVTVEKPRPGLTRHLGTVEEIVIPLSAALILLFGILIYWYITRPASARALLEKALRDRLVVTHYQPVVELTTNRCVGAEALVRISRPDGSLVPPDQFIPFAEDTGLIQPITDRVIETVVRDMAGLLQSDRSVHIAINVPAIDLRSGRILVTLDQSLKGTGIEPRQIWLEATERGFINTVEARATLQELRRRGHRVAIDDFGTGYSNLQYLEHLPVDALKIDKSFIETVGTAAATSRVTEYIISMAEALKLMIVAEGVESEAQARYLREQNVKYAQGWLFARALPAAEFLAYIRQNQDKSPDNSGDTGIPAKKALEARPN